MFTPTTEKRTILFSYSSYPLSSCAIYLQTKHLISLEKDNKKQTKVNEIKDQIIRISTATKTASNDYCTNCRQISVITSKRRLSTWTPKSVLLMHQKVWLFARISKLFQMQARSMQRLLSREIEGQKQRRDYYHVVVDSRFVKT